MFPPCFLHLKRRPNIRAAGIMGPIASQTSVLQRKIAEMEKKTKSIPQKRMRQIEELDLLAAQEVAIMEKKIGKISKIL